MRAASTRSNEPPGFMLLNYGRQTPLVALTHLAYGAIVVAFVSAAG